MATKNALIKRVATELRAEADRLRLAAWEIDRKGPRPGTRNGPAASPRRKKK